jgi:hypothetical protein
VGKGNLWTAVLKLVPGQLAPEELLTEQFSRADSEFQEAEAAIGLLRSQVEEFNQRIEVFQGRADRELLSIRGKALDERSASVTTRESTLADLSGQQRTAEAALLAPQQDASEVWNRLGIFPPCKTDQVMEAWSAQLALIRQTLDTHREKLAFLSRWAIAIESATKELTDLFWETNQVFFSTCVGLSSWRSFHKHFGRDGVDLAIIDEAAHATLTQSLIPMGRAKRVALIGDEMQLPPAPPMELRGRCEQSCSARCTEQQAAPSDLPCFKPPMSACWLERSAFEWLMETRPFVPRVMLNRQFRMHPDIADFVGDVFYGGQLENGVTAGQRSISFGDFSRAVCLISTSNYKDRHEESPASGETSLRNPLETELARRILRQARDGLQEEADFGIVTPYAAQCTLMRDTLAEYFAPGGRIRLNREDVASVDSFQGSERDVMIASFVRSPRPCNSCNGRGMTGDSDCQRCRGRGYAGPRLHWVHDLRRLNVALSRARKMLILIGDIEALTARRSGSREGAEVLGRFFNHVRDRGRVLQLWEEDQHV